MRFERNWTPEPNTGCWLWAGEVDGRGRGQINIGPRKARRVSGAHRISYELHVGPIPAGLFVLHRCGIRHCVNPGHLFVGTRLDSNGRRRTSQMKIVDSVSSRKHPLYMTWLGMKQRCHNPKSRNFKWYGARGIAVCRRWRESFLAFVGDVGPRPGGTTIDRINVDGNYEPGNVRWATALQQNRNRTNSRRAG